MLAVCDLEVTRDCAGHDRVVIDSENYGFFHDRSDLPIARSRLFNGWPRAVHVHDCSKHFRRCCAKVVHALSVA
jgi:hypothetical protein